MKPLNELLTALSFSDEELECLIVSLTTLRDSLIPFSPHYDLALYDVNRRLEAFENMLWHRKGYKKMIALASTEQE